MSTFCGTMGNWMHLIQLYVIIFLVQALERKKNKQISYGICCSFPSWGPKNINTSNTSRHDYISICFQYSCKYDQTKACFRNFNLRFLILAPILWQGVNCHDTVWQVICHCLVTHTVCGVFSLTAIITKLHLILLLCVFTSTAASLQLKREVNSFLPHFSRTSHILSSHN